MKSSLLLLLRETNINIYIEKAASAKKAFLICKEKTAAWSAFSEESDLLASYKRYQILDTTVRSYADAQMHVEAIYDTDLKLRNKCLGCLILEDSHYLFFIPKKEKTND